MTDPLESFIVTALLRYFRPGVSMSATGTVEVADRDLMVLHWSISPAMFKLATYLAEHPHEVKSVLNVRRAESSSLRGRIIAGESSRLQLRNADPSIFVIQESYRSHESGANRVLTWTIAYASQLARRFRSILPPAGNYAERTVLALRAIEIARRALPNIETLRVKPPTPDDVRAARRSRQPLYRLAVAAYENLRAIQRLKRDAVDELLTTTLVGPMERWRQFEFALALGMANAASKATGHPARLNYINPGNLLSLATIGPYIVRWQGAGPMFAPFVYTQWEQRTVDILDAYNVRSGWDRPDVVLFDSRTGRTLAIGEAKYFETASWTDAMRDAANQLVGYARGYDVQQGDTEDVLRRSILALWKVDGVYPKSVDGQPTLVQFEGLQDALNDWATSGMMAGVLDAPPLPASGMLSSTGSGAG